VAAHAGTDLARGGRVIPRHVAGDDGRDDAALTGADAVASLVPMLLRYRQAVGSNGRTCLGWLTALVATAYLLVWTGLGLVIFPLGAALATIEMQLPEVARVVPIGVAVIVMLAGALQCTGWKAHHLACCRQSPGPGKSLPAHTATAWRHGLRLGVHCCYCCAGPMTILLVVGVMDLWTMAVVTLAITAERLLPAGGRIARVSGIIAIGAEQVCI